MIVVFFLHLTRKAGSSRRDFSGDVGHILDAILGPKSASFTLPPWAATSFSCVVTTTTVADRSYNFVAHVWNVLLNWLIRHAQNVPPRPIRDRLRVLVGVRA